MHSHLPLIRLFHAVTIFLLCSNLLYIANAAVAISIKPDSVEVGQEIIITATNPDDSNYIIKKIIFTAHSRTQEFVIPDGFTVLAKNSLIVTAGAPFKLPCSMNAVGAVTVTALNETGETLAVSNFTALRTVNALPTLFMHPDKLNAQEYRVGDIVTFSIISNCNDYSLFTFANAQLTIKNTTVGKLSLAALGSFSFDASMNAVIIKVWQIPAEYYSAGITTAVLKYTIKWPNGIDVIETQIPFFIKGSITDVPAAMHSHAPYFSTAPDCDAIIKGRIVTVDNQFFIYNAKAKHEEAAIICSCFYMNWAPLSKANSTSVRANVLGTIGASTVWVQDYNDLYGEEKIVALVSEVSITVEKIPQNGSPEFYVICKPKQ